MSHSFPKFVLASCGAVTLLTGAQAASAQDAALTRDVEKGLANIDANLTSPSTTSDGGRLRPAARIVGGTDDTSVQITFSTHSEGKGLPSTTDFSLTLTAPLDEDTGRGDFLTVDGLPSQWSVGGKLSFSLFNFDGINQRIGGRGSYLRKASENCLIKERKPGIAEDELQEKCNLMESQVGDYLDEADIKILNDERNAVYRELMGRSFVVVNIAGNVGTQEFKYFDSTTLAENSSRKYSWSGGVSIGYLPSIKSKVYFIGGFEAKRNYRDATKATYCPTGAATPTVKCTTGPFGPPVEETDYKFAAKARIQIRSNVGIELAGAYDAKDNSWGLEAPLYFIMDKDGGLTGGIRAAYDSKEKDVQFGIFIGKTFDFLKL